MSEEQWGVCVLQAGVAGAEYAEFDSSRAAFELGESRVMDLGGSNYWTPFVPDESCGVWRAESTDWSVIVKRWR